GQPDVRVVNLETSVTRSGDYWEGKEVHYRMHPENVACLTAARIDIAVMANNHVLDWGMAGLVETIANSHHARPIEMYRNRLILYGCGDLVNDYEGIAGYGEFRDDLAVMYFPTIDTATGELVQLRMVPMQIRKLSLHRPSPADVQWLGDTIAQISAGFGSSIERADGSLVLRWRS
ncbi:MAG TPA: CapA family protein, partial [Gemmatimonadales bacterium]|nr:CapA family protein [Gemmatimonadales bacterium]